MLDPAVVVLESGGFETRSEYTSHHMPGDMAFAGAVERDGQIRRVSVVGDMAWVASTGDIRGEFRGRAVNAGSAELAVLARRGDAWRIVAIHWSSRSRQ